MSTGCEMTGGLKTDKRNSLRVSHHCISHDKLCHAFQDLSIAE